VQNQKWAGMKVTELIPGSPAAGSAVCCSCVSVCFFVLLFVQFTVAMQCVIVLQCVENSFLASSLQVLQSVALYCCRVLQDVAGYCRVLQGAAGCCKVVL